MNFLKLFFLVLICLLTLNSCKKEDPPTSCELLEGKWKCISWTLDDLEVLGFLMNYSVLDFEKLENNEGEYDWVIKNIDGGFEILDGLYSVDFDCSQIQFTPTTYPLGGNGFFELDFDVMEDELVLEGFNAGYIQKMTFKR